jgi:hypothetical protein
VQETITHDQLMPQDQPDMDRDRNEQQHVRGHVQRQQVITDE